jgi:hypothetical protein
MRGLNYLRNFLKFYLISIRIYCKIFILMQIMCAKIYTVRKVYVHPMLYSIYSI